VCVGALSPWVFLGIIAVKNPRFTMAHQIVASVPDATDEFVVASE
jgi:hypothetical protein